MTREATKRRRNPGNPFRRETDRTPRSIKRLINLTAGAVACLMLVPTPVLAARQHQNAWVYTFWNFGGASGFVNVDQHLRIGQKAPTSFWATSWYWSGDPSSPGYIGLQTDGVRFDGTRGEMAIFSLWDATAAVGRSCGTFGGEGVGYSCRLAFPITTGRLYRLRVERMEADSVGQWWGGWVKDESTGIDHFIGKIRVAPTFTTMSRLQNFSEYFGRQVHCDKVPVSVVYWTPIVADRQEDGTYRSGSTFDRGKVGPCTGGGVTPYEFESGTRGVKVIQGGRR